MLGADCNSLQSKAMAAFLSGEMKDTVQMNPAGSYVLERFFSRAERRKLFLSWAGSASMWIKGGDTVWGNSTWAPDDIEGSAHSHGELIAFRRPVLSAEDFKEDLRNMTSEQGGTWILEHTPSTFQKMMATNYSFGIERDEAILAQNDLDHRKWTNPLEVRLPNAPSMKFFCVYGHGKETERSYWYARGEYEFDESFADGLNPVCTDPDDPGCTSARSALDMPLLRKNWIDAEYTDDTASPKVVNGVKIGEGDGTVSLISLGAMCVEGWKRPRWNPAGINVTTVELPHRPVPALPRGGANTSEHVDVLGSTALNEIIVKVATGAGDEIKENFVSDIRKYARRIAWD
ncbi:phospholipid:diacylglycerol acyltransferase [Stygiomarasmius scandens]|uniref:Phospholipid:diacylglycerol acyltransferase n=1 Tax=Marasmiellus scandens TaxID=2682957 RepID=A0ABR1K6J4_9AGAR